MSEIKVKDLANVTTLATTNKLMVLTNGSNNTVCNITVENAIKSIISTDSNNKIIRGTDGKLYVEAFSNITGDLDNLTTSNKTNLVNAINEVNGNVGTLSNLETTEKSNLVSAINEIANVVEPSLQYDVMNNSKAMETGDVYSNSVIYQDVYKYAYSSFDKSKFRTVGSPVITSDGILVRPTNENHAYILISISSYNKLTIKSKFRYTLSNTDTSYKTLFSLHNTTSAASSSQISYLRLRYDGFYIGRIYEGALVGGGYNYTFEFDKWYDVEFIIENGLITLKIDGAVVEDNIACDMLDIAALTIGSHSISGGLSFMYGDIDLKHLQLFNNDVKIFSGNKTGLDIIKPDNYTIVGEPTISTDGIASGFNNGSNSYLLTNINTTEAKEVIIEGDFVPQEGTSATQYIYSANESRRNNLYLNSSRHLQLDMGDGTTATWGSIRIASNLTYGQKYSFKIIYTQELVSYYFNGNYVGATFIDNTFDMSKIIKTIGNADVSYAHRPFYGSIDLNAFKVYVDGNLVYQPCLKIPYTASADKYGSKIVDNHYIDRVQSCYEQGYPQKYYTIDEVNNSFALPMGEVYGMIEKRADINLSNVNITSDFATILNNAGIITIVDYYFSGTSYYYTFSNNVCVQGGSVLVVDEGQKINLLKNYINTNYVVTSGGGTKRFGNTAVYDKTTSQFTAWTSDDYTFNAGVFNWQAIGKIA